MKKFAILAGVMVLGASMALAGSLTVPWFNDQAPTGNGPFPVVPNTWIGIVSLHNNTGTGIEITLEYILDGTPMNDGGSATKVIAADSSLAWRLTHEDAAAEGAGPAGLARATSEWGSLKVSWTGASTDIQGRYSERRMGANTSALDGFSFLLPPGT